MNRSKLKWIIPLSLLLIVLIAAVTWQIIQSRITAKVEAQLQQTLREFNWEDKVKWESLSVSPAGTLTLNRVRFEYFPDAVVNMEQLRISDVIDNADRQRIRLQLKQSKAELPEITTKGVPAALFNPVDADLQLDLNFASNQAQILYKSQQAGTADIEIQLNLSEIGALRGILATVFPKSSAAMQELDPNFIGLNRLAAIYSISIKAFDGKIHNNGLVELLTAELTQEMNKENKGMGEQTFMRLVQDVQFSCHDNQPALIQPCQTLADFFLAKQSNLHISARPAQPVSLQQLDGGNNAAVFKLLNINIQ